MLIDTHCHLDATEFAADRAQIATQALALGVAAIVVPAVARANFDQVMLLAAQHRHCAYALGIHPLYVAQAADDDIASLEADIQSHNAVAIGEIGLDYFVHKPQLNPENIDRQIFFFCEQLKIAQRYQLPVLLHVRHAVDDVLKYLRRYPVVAGIAHAFNGSLQQAEQFIALGFKLGFGGAMTYSRALKIRALAAKLPLESIVLETDAPDMAPSWLPVHERNSPLQLVQIAQVLADLRQVNVAQVIDITGHNALKVLPKLADLCTPPHVLL